MSSQPTIQTEPNSPFFVYKYCPKCGGGLEYKGGNLLKCTQCGYNFFVNAIPAASVLIINENNEILLTKRKFEPYKDMWQTPGGFIQLNETYEDAVKREIDEELGVKIRLGEFLGAFPEAYPYHGVNLQFLSLISLAEIVSGEIKAKDDVAEARFFDKRALEGIEIAYPFLEELIRRSYRL